MALFDSRNELKCELCGMNVFTEKTMYMYTKEKGRNKDIVVRHKVGEFLECTNPKCRNTINIKNDLFFVKTEIVDKD